MERIKLGVFDPHPITLIGLKSVFINEPDMQTQFFVASVESLANKLEEFPIDVLLCDHECRGSAPVDGLHVLGRIRTISPRTRVVVHSSSCSIHAVQAALAQGAAGYVIKGEADAFRLLEAVRTVHAGRVYLPSTVSKGSLSNTSDISPITPGIAALSRREMNVIKLVYEGFSISEIANRVCRSPKTISNQKHAAMKKLGVRNDVELASAIRDLGIF